MPPTDPNPNSPNASAERTVAQSTDAAPPTVGAVPTSDAAPIHDVASSNDAASLKRRAVLYLLTTAALMAALYALAYHSWDTTSLPGRMLTTYLGAVAQASAASLRLLGEQVTLAGPTVSGRFSYVVVVDCAAIDVQALFVAAVLAFPTSWKTRLIGLVCGVSAIFVINLTRLVVLYYAGASSLDLFNTLHEEVFVLVIVALVCGLFLMWARWATLHSSLVGARRLETPALGGTP